MMGSVVFIGCENKEPIRCVLPNPSISSNSPVISGESLVLTTPTYPSEANTTYEWTGPNGFQSNQQNPVISNATIAMAGDYKLKITKGICASEEITTTVNVISNTVTCNQNNDTANFTGMSNYSFYYNTAHANGSNEYEIMAGGSQADIFVTFPGTDTPVAGIYSIVNKNTSLSPGKVHVTMQVSNVLNYYANSGDVLVYYDINNKVVTKFCSVPFSFSTNTGTDTTGSAKFTENQ